MPLAKRAATSMATLAVVAILVAWPAAAAGAGNPHQVVVRVSKNHLVDGQGNTLRLLGVNRSGSEFMCILEGTPGARGFGMLDGPTDDASAQAIASWHANAVRLPLNEDCWLGINGVNPQWSGPAYQAAISGYVSTLHRAGMVVILDLHWSAPAGIPAIGQQPMPDADHSPTFWRSVAATFHDDPGVVFDLFNEPYPNSSFMQDKSLNPWRCWVSGCVLVKYAGEGGTTPSYTWRAAGMQSLVDNIRATGARQPILIAGVGWGNDLTGWLQYPVTDPAGQLVASWHSYPRQPCSSIDCWDRWIRPVSDQVPLVIGETGDSVCGEAGFVPGLLSWADGAGLSYLGWTWNVWSHCDNVLITSYDGAPTPHFGTVFRDHLRSLSQAPAQITTGATNPSGPTQARRFNDAIPVALVGLLAAALVMAGALWLRARRTGAQPPV
jgi:endoglucanase